VDQLNDAIRRLTKENKEAFVKRMKLEAEKNKLENLLTNNLVRRKDELVQALQEITVEDRQRLLDTSKTQLSDIEKRLLKNQSEFKSQNEKVAAAAKKVSFRGIPF
jgi:structural maintenance of chromosome 3 (chondroitin sulfate proteoglycan 6)